MKKVLITGGTGLLGSHVAKVKSDLLSFYAISEETMDICNMKEIMNTCNTIYPDIILHCAAMTVPMSEHKDDPGRSIAVNIVGTANIAQTCLNRGIKMVYISTDYVYPGDHGWYSEDDPLYPVNEYAWSKLGGECVAKLVPDSLTLRCSHTGEFRHSKAFVNSYKSYMYADEIAPVIVKLLEKDASGVVNVGGPRTSVYQFASRTKIVEPILRSSVPGTPKDTSFNLTKLNGILND